MSEIRNPPLRPPRWRVTAEGSTALRFECDKDNYPSFGVAHEGDDGTSFAAVYSSFGGAVREDREVDLVHMLRRAADALECWIELGRPSGVFGLERRR